MSVQTPRMLGNANKYAILHMIRERGQISRANLARELNMSPPTVSANISALLEAGLIAEVGSDSTDMGRKPILLEYSKDFRYVICADIGETSVKFAVSNLTGEIVSTAEDPIDPERGAKYVLTVITRRMRDIISDSKLSRERFGVIVIAVPGIVDEESGEIRLSTIIGQWEGVKLGKTLEDELNIPVILGNDVDMAILGEHCSRRGKESENLVYIKMGDGLAARVLIDGKIFKGKNNSAGEIGYMLVDKHEIQSSFSSRGALERCVCNDKADSEYRAACAKAGVACDSKMITIARLLEFSQNGDEIATGILRHMFSYLALSLVNLTSVLDIGLIILGGDAEHTADTFLMDIREFLGRHVPFVPEIEASTMRGMAGITGCTSLGVQYLEDKMSSMW